MYFGNIHGRGLSPSLFIGDAVAYKAFVESFLVLHGLPFLEKSVSVWLVIWVIPRLPVHTTSFG